MSAHLSALAELDYAIQQGEFDGHYIETGLREVRAVMTALIEACEGATCQCPRGAWRTAENPCGQHHHDCHLGNIPSALARCKGAGSDTPKPARPAKGNATTPEIDHAMYAQGFTGTPGTGRFG